MKKMTVYPDPWVYEVLGRTSPLLNQALEAWARLIALASRDNEEAFSPEEWCLVADVCNGTLWYGMEGSPGLGLAANVEDGHRLGGAGSRWFGDADDDLAGSAQKLGLARPTKGTRAVDAKVAALVKKLAALDVTHGWAVIVAVQWFWNNTHLQFDPRATPWWTLAHRKQAAQAAAGER